MEKILSCSVDRKFDKQESFLCYKLENNGIKISIQITKHKRYVYEKKLQKSEVVLQIEITKSEKVSYVKIYKMISVVLQLEITKNRRRFYNRNYKSRKLFIDRNYDSVPLFPISIPIHKKAYSLGSDCLAVERRRGQSFC